MARWLLILLSALLLTGCWDRREIEDVGFIVGVAIDMTESDDSKQGEEASTSSGDKPKYVMTFQQVTPTGIQQSSGKNGSPNQQAYRNISTEGNTMMEAVKYIASRTARVPFFEQQKALLFSEDVAKSEGFRELIDFFLRYPEIQRNMRVFVVKGSAKEALDIAPNDIKLPAFYLNRIIANMEKSSRVIPEAQLGDIHERMLSDRSFTALHIVVGKQDIGIVGNAVFSGRDNRMVGVLDGEDIEGRNLITGIYTSGGIKAKFRDANFTYDIAKVMSSIDVEDPDPNNLKFTINLKVEGDISEIFEQVDLFQPQILQELESLIEAEMIRLTERTVMKCQKEYETDVIGLSEYLNKKHPKLWLKVKHNWETGKKYFMKSKITIKPEVLIRTSGVIIKSR